MKTHGFRILTKRLPEKGEAERVHVEKLDLTEEAMFALVQLSCKTEGYVTVLASLINLIKKAQRNGENK